MPRTWFEIDWEQDRPTDDEVARSWAGLTWESVPVVEEPVLRYAEALRRTHVNGGVLLGRWRATGSTDVVAWFLARNRLDEYGLHRHLFTATAVRADLRELQVPESLEPVPAGLTEQWAGSLCLDGVLAGLLTAGGAYKAFDGPAARAKMLAAEAVAALVQDRFEEVRVDLSHRAWTPWFSGVAWDATLVVTDRGRQEVTVLCATDTD